MIGEGAPPCSAIIGRCSTGFRRLRNSFGRWRLMASHIGTAVSPEWFELGAIAVVLRFVDEVRSPFGRARFHIIEASPIMEKFPMRQGKAFLSISR
jgi:hypothetical protein